MSDIKIGVIGGSGVYQMEALEGVEHVGVSTPFGDPSDEFVLGNLGEHRVAFLPRHGRGHRIMPSEVNSRANIYAFKKLGVERLISISAAGSMREGFAPLDIVIPSQLFDRTLRPNRSFFGEGIVGHISFADPFCPEMSEVLYEAAKQIGATVHRGGTMVVIDGPQFSTKAESQIFFFFLMDIIGMTALPEARLAREAEICYATVALVTDYDVWHPGHDTVTVEMVVANLLKNAETGKKIVQLATPHIPAERKQCPCYNALENAIITSREMIPPKRKENLELIIGKYIK